MEGDVFRPQNLGPHAVQAEELVQPQRNRQVDTALRHAGDGYRPAVLSAVARVNHHRLLRKSGGCQGLDAAGPPAPQEIPGSQCQRGHQGPG